MNGSTSQRNQSEPVQLLAQDMVQIGFRMKIKEILEKIRETSFLALNKEGYFSEKKLVTLHKPGFLGPKISEPR